MKYICKNDLLYASIFAILTVLVGIFFADNTVTSFYQFSYYNFIDKDMIALLFVAFWAFPKVFAILYLVQFFTTSFETCYIYFKVRSQNNNLWFYHILKSICMKLLVFTLIKLLIILILNKELDIALFLYEYLYLLLFVFIYNSLYLLIRHEKFIIYLVMLHLVIYEVSFMLNLQSLERYIFMCNIDGISILLVSIVTVISIGVFSFLLKYKHNTDGGRV